MTTFRQRAGRYIGEHYPAALIRYYLHTKSRHYEPELWLVPKLRGRARAAIDVGANQGIWSLQLARYFERVYAFEPNPVCIRALGPILPSNVALHRVALSDRKGEAELRFDPGNTGIGTIEANNTLSSNAGIKAVDSTRVETACLDDFELRDIDFLKIDVEGHEEAVLTGASSLLKRERPAIICEIEERHNPGGLARVRAVFNNLGYRSAAIDGKRLRSLSEIEADGVRALASAQGINNFVFLPEEPLPHVID